MPLKLIFACPFFDPATQYGGPITVMREISKHLAARGHELKVVSSDLGIPESIDRAVWLEKDGYEVCYMPAGKLGALPPHHIPAIGKKLKEVLPDADLLHLHLGFTGVNVDARKIAKALKKPYVLTPHGVYGRMHMKQKKLAKKAFNMLFEQKLIHDARFIQVLAEAEAEASIQNGARQEQLRIIPNGVDLQWDAEGGKALTAYDGVDPQKKTLLFLARLNSIKGLDLLIPAFHACANPEWQLVLAGPDDDYGEQARQLAKKCQAKNIIFPGPLSGADKAAALRDADAFVLCSYGEGLPMGPLEACANGKAVLLSRSCNLPEIERIGAGFICETEKTSVEAGLKKLMGKCARNLVEEKFSWPVVVDALESMYLDALKNPEDS